MWRQAIRVSPAFIFPILENRNENDQDALNNKKTNQVLETGMDRVRNMYRRNELDEVTVELHSVIQSSLCGTFIGACMGGFFHSRIAYMNFIENNQATSFVTTRQAQFLANLIVMLDVAYPTLMSRSKQYLPYNIMKRKKLQDHVTLAFAKGAYTWGWRLGIFTGLFSLISTTIQVYRGETSLVEYITAGMVTGALYKANMGLAATLVGAGLGGVLSTIGGLAILAILKVTGVTIDDIRNALFKIKQARQDQLNQAMEKASTIKNDDLTRHHAYIVSELGETKVEEIK